MAAQESAQPRPQPVTCQRGPRGQEPGARQRGAGPERDQPAHQEEDAEPAARAELLDEPALSPAEHRGVDTLGQTCYSLSHERGETLMEGANAVAAIFAIGTVIVLAFWGWLSWSDRHAHRKP